ncbi:deaminated glutathione amidase-like [Biomphalaria glabrata]|uniref:Nitrilase and fragile histidine triad fusion protein NitFhit n=1 Tax=Biomphalaria glabrata TaxID=6526 RepID=A0A9W2YPP1_BIOGL|nr:deaminated glutathione amidase-like [Biomphalaria glabrata]XP_055864745.1 deaminated glutathione amidase-like [Biomphalaria glabrata]XP_055864747.1 deaminated glutathione amidase-like [Biomphalaria glabrata]XP_055864748.1 deaminated glutathione amidase-like [Biomphalaria glabrata]XP_055864749.1 deaminated glutathione amidase-like [Biomphalaria glabrata]XP_055864750.1 deaminated glutathione amidase-like [Biomphalaria glabrata]XP_055864751.1 deaminated glutathione amidase-like [Biomphalaria 
MHILHRYFHSYGVKNIFRLIFRRPETLLTNMAAFSQGNTARQKSLIAVCQMTATSQKNDNVQTILNLVSKASAMGAQMVFLPEACDYIGESKEQSLDLSEPITGTFLQEMKTAAVQNKVWLSIGGYHQKGPDTEKVPKIINTHVIIDDQGNIQSAYGKTHLFDVDIPGKVRLCESDSVIPGTEIVPPVPTPIGRIGLAICYDMRFPELALSLAQQGAQIITYPSAFTQTTGMAHWESILRARAIETQCYVVAAAQTGKHNVKRSSYGHAMVVDPWGAIIAQCSEGVSLCLAEIDLDYVAKVRSEMPVWQHRRTDLYGRVTALHSDSSIISPEEQDSYQFGHVIIKSSQVFYRTLLSLAFVNIKPVLPGHVLVAPIRPVERLSDLSPAEVTDLFMTVQQVVNTVKQCFDVPSSTIAVQDGVGAGQTVKHVHVHVVPRKQGDLTNNDDIYDHLENHDKCWSETRTVQSEQDMATQSQRLRLCIYPSP